MKSIPRKSAEARIIAFIVALAALFVLMPLFAYADTDDKPVRVGWYESGFNRKDQYGRRSGYAYEYQRKIAAYTGWKYEYVEGTWPELLKKLERGEIDLLSDVSYTDERKSMMLYSSIPMGTESYYIFISPDDKDITADDFRSLNGKTVGVDRDSIQADIFREWEKTHGVNAELKEMTAPAGEALAAVNDGKLDAYLTTDIYSEPGITMPLCKIGQSDFYFAVSNERSDLLYELDAALNSIQEEDRNYNHTLYEKYFRSTGANLYLTADEQKWLKKHKTIKVGYQDNYLAFCAKDPDTGELTGALKDYLDFASTGFENGEIDFQAVSYPTAADAIEALMKGEVDCMFPANLTDFDGENLSVVMTPALMRTEMDAVVRADDQKEFIKTKDIAVAVNKGNTNYEMFLKDNYPDCRIVYFDDTPAGLEGVAEGKADCVIISNYRYNNISRQCEDLHLTTVYTGVDMDYSLAVREGDSELYSILSKVTDIVPEATINAALTYYSTEDVKMSFADYIKDYLAVIMTVVALVLLIILLLTLRSIHLEKKAREEEHLVNDLNRQVFVDPLTSVRNKGAITKYIDELQGRIENDEKIEIAVGVFDCNDLKQINDTFGHDKGDEYLKAASKLICNVFQHSPVFRIGGDEFAVILQNEDYHNRDDLVAAFRENEEEINSSAENEWDKVNVAMGIAEYDPAVDGTIIDTMRRADKIMYENKRTQKKLLPDRDDVL